MHETDGPEQRLSPLAMSSGEFRLLGHQLVDRVADFLDSLPGRLVTTGESPRQIRQALDAGRTLPEVGSDPAKLIGRAADLLFDFGVILRHRLHPLERRRIFGTLADLLAAVINPNVGAWPLSPTCQY